MERDCDNSCEWFYNKVCICEGVKPCDPIKKSKTKLTAHWIDVSDATTDNGGYDWHIRDLQCNNCGNLVRAYHGPRYCNECGARMVKNETD